jgi:Protein of unknown function (DUF3775)
MRRIFIGEESGAAEAELGISREKIAGIIDHARMFDAKEANSDPNSGSNPTDDGMADILEDKGRDNTRRELLQLIRDLNVDEQSALVALAWVGRGTYSGNEWDEAVSQAKQAHNDHTAEYLLGLPMLGNYLEDGLAQLDAATAARLDRQFTP